MFVAFICLVALDLWLPRTVTRHVHFLSRLSSCCLSFYSLLHLHVVSVMADFSTVTSLPYSDEVPEARKSLSPSRYSLVVPFTPVNPIGGPTCHSYDPRRQIAVRQEQQSIEPSLSDSSASPARAKQQTSRGVVST